MDALVQTARKHPQVSSVEEHVQLLKRLEGVGRSLRKATAAQVDGGLAQGQLDASQHCYPLVLLLSTRLEVALESRSAVPPSVWGGCHDLFSAFSPLSAGSSPLRFCLADAFHLAALYTRAALATHRPAAPLLSFSTALRALHVLSPHGLTPLHAHFVRLCVLSKHYHLALPVLSVPLYSVRHAKDGVDALLYVEFFYYSGLVWAAYKRWSRAVEAFHLCLAPPANAVSAVQVAAYKKLILVQLMDTGEVLQRHLDGLVQPYLDLAKAFTRSLASTHSSPSTVSSPPMGPLQSLRSGDAATLDLSALTLQHREAFLADRTYGLVKQLSVHVVQMQVQRLTATYLTLPLTSLSSLVRAPAQLVERWLSLLIGRGAISARIDGRLSLVEFLEADDDGGGAGERRLIRLIDGQIEGLLTTRAAVRSLNRHLALHPVYIAKALQSEKDAEGSGGGGGAPNAGEAGKGSTGRGGPRAGAAQGTAMSDEEQLRLAVQQSLAEQ